MQPISSIVAVNIVRGVRSITKAGFGTPLMLAETASFQGIRSYASLNEVAADFMTSSLEYLAATRLFSAEIKPKKIKIMGRSAVVAMVQTVTPDAATQAVTSYSVTINGIVFTFTSDASPTAAEVVTGLAAAINAGTEPVTASGTATLILTADQAGIPFTLTVGPKLSKVTTVGGNGLVDDAAKAANLDLDWYGLMIVSRNDVEAFAIAQWIETQRKLFVYSTQAVGSYDTTSTTDFLARAKAANLTRTVGLYSAVASQYPEGSWLSDELPRDPGSYTMKFKTLIGVAADTLSSSQVAAIKGKNGNVFTNVGSVDMVSEGKVAFGEFVDTIRFIDWLTAQIEEGVFGTLVSTPKIPFTDKGIAVIEGQIRFALERGVAAGGIADDTPYDVTVPKVGDISVQDRQARSLSGLKFYARLSGAIHFVDIAGTVGV